MGFCVNESNYTLYTICVIIYLTMGQIFILKSVEKTSIKKNTKKYVIPFSRSMLLGQRR